MSEKNKRIHEVVKEHYGAAAARVEAGEACCANPCSCCADATPQLYPTDLLAELPVDVGGFSLGCGDPVTIAALQPGETVLDLGSGPGLDCFLAARQVGPSGHVIGVDMTAEMLRQVGFVDVQIVDKVDAESIVQREPGMPRLFSARIVGRKPA